MKNVGEYVSFVTQKPATEEQEKFNKCQKMAKTV